MTRFGWRPIVGQHFRKKPVSQSNLFNPTNLNFTHHRQCMTRPVRNLSVLDLRQVDFLVAILLSIHINLSLKRKLPQNFINYDFTQLIRIIKYFISNGILLTSELCTGQTD